MHVLDRLAAPRAAAAKRPPRAGVGSRRGRAVARAAKPSGPAPAGAPADSEVKAEGADGWVCSGDACERDGTVVSRAALAADAGSEFEVCLPEDLEAAPGELTEIERSAPYLERDAFRCVGCVRPECQTPAGCATMPWRTADAGYLRAVLTSKVYDVAVEAPLEEAKRLSEATGNRVFLKREDLQPVFSFKLRGAYNKIASLTDEELARGVICSSAGNHAQGVALGASRRGARAIICMPTTTPAIKIESVKRLGGEVVLEGETYSDTQTYAQERATREGLTFVAPYDDPCVIAGQGTIGAEILRQVDSRGVDTIFVAIGGGGLAAGIAAYVKALQPHVRVIGVEPAGSNAMALSLARGRRVSLAKVDAFADGVAVKLVGAETFRLCRELLDGIVLVSNSQISAAIKDVFNETRSILEPAGAVSVAGAKAYYDAHPTERGTTAVCVTSGANMNFDRLRLVSELADVGARSEAMLVTTIPESPGSFSDFVEVGYYGAAPQDAAEVTEFKYRYDECAGQGKAHILHSVAVKSRDELKRMIARLNGAGYQTRDLSAMEDAQVHLRHLVGGRAGAVRNERLFVVEFPERPGALKIFLRPFSPRWNVTAFHYRRSGNQVSSVLVGLQVPVEDEGEFKDAVAGLDSGFAFRELSAEAYEAFKYFLS